MLVAHSLRAAEDWGASARNGGTIVALNRNALKNYDAGDVRSTERLRCLEVCTDLRIRGAVCDLRKILSFDRENDEVSNFADNGR